jgi:hypothetical protein
VAIVDGSLGDPSQTHLRTAGACAIRDRGVIPGGVQGGVQPLQALGFAVANVPIPLEQAGEVERQRRLMVEAPIECGPQVVDLGIET